MFCRIIIFSACLALFNTSIALAKEEKKALTKTLLELSLVELMEINITAVTKTAETSANIPATIHLITQEQIRTRGYKSVLDVLKDLPGINFSQNTLEQNYNNIASRGISGTNRFLVLLDGVRIDSPSTDNLPMAENYPLYHVKQVEVLFGPASAIYGADAFAGVVNLVTDENEDTQRATISATTGSDGYRHVSGYGTTSLGSDKLKLSAGAHHHTVDNADLAHRVSLLDLLDIDFNSVLLSAEERKDRYQTPVRSHSGFIKLELFKQLTLGFNRSYFRHSSAAGTNGLMHVFKDDVYMENQVDTAYAKLKLDLSDKLDSLTTLSYQEYEQKPDSNFFNIITDYRPMYVYAYRDKYEIEQQFNYQLMPKHLLTLGLNYTDYYTIPNTPELIRPYDTSLSPSEQTHLFVDTDLPIFISEYSHQNKAVYLQWKADWNTYFSTLISARYDNNALYSDSVVPRIGFVFTPRPETIFKFMYGEGLRAPSSQQSSATVLGFSGEKNTEGNYISDFLLVSNPELKPEELRTIEVSLTNHITQDFSLSLAAYYTKMGNLIANTNNLSLEDIDLNSLPVANIAVDPLLIGQYQNLGRGRHYGLDIQAQYQRKLNENWHVNLWGNYSYVDGYIMLNERQTMLPYVSKNLFKLGSSFTYRNRYFINTRLFAADKTNKNIADQSSFSDQNVQLGAYAVVDLRLGAYRVYHGLSAYVDVLNVLDHEYTHAGQSFIASLRGVPQPERTFYFSLQYDF